MKRIIVTAVLGLGLFLSGQSVAMDKAWSVGVSRYSNALGSAYWTEPFAFGGFNLFGSYAFNDNFAARGAYFFAREVDFPELKASGIDALLKAGTGLATEGVKAYAGVGFYSETWKNGSGWSESFSGTQLALGVGYNWQQLDLDFTMGFRSTGAYATYFGQENSDMASVSVGLSAGYRF